MDDFASTFDFVSSFSVEYCTCIFEVSKLYLWLDPSLKDTLQDLVVFLNLTVNLCSSIQVPSLVK